MEKIWIIGISLFLIVTFLFWRLTHNYSRKKYGEKMWKRGETKLVYWQVAIYISIGITFLIMYLLKWTNILTF